MIMYRNPDPEKSACKTEYMYMEINFHPSEQK